MRNIAARTAMCLLHRQYTPYTHEAQSLITEFRKKTEYVDRFQDLSQLFEQYSSKQDSDQNISIMFAIACRSYSRIFLKANEHDIFNVRAFLGNRLQLLEKVQLDQLNISDIADINSFINAMHSRFFINYRNPTLRKFIENLLVAFLSKKAELSEDRAVSYFTKAIRCVQLYHLQDAYHEVLRSFQQIPQQIRFYHAVSLFNSIMRGKPRTQTNDLEIAIMRKCLALMSEGGWGQKCTNHEFNDLIFPFTDFQNTMPFILRQYPEFSALWESVNRHLEERYKEMTGEEITRFCKTLQKVNPACQFNKNVLRTIFVRISEEGQAKIDPIFAIRFIGGQKDSKVLSSVCSNWQERFTKLVERYFYKQRNNLKFVVGQLIYLIENGFLQQEYAERIYQMLLAIAMQKNVGVLSTNFLSELLLNLFDISVRLFRFDDTPKIMGLIRDFENKKFDDIYYYLLVFREFSSSFFRSLGVLMPKEALQPAPQIPGKKNVLFGKPKYTPSTLSSLRNLISIDESAKSSAGNLNRINLAYLEKSIQQLRFSLNYSSLISLLQAANVSSSIVQVVFSEMANLQIPEAIQLELTYFFYPYLNSQNAILFIYFNLLRSSKYVRKRCSRLQAIYFFNLLKTEEREQQALILSERLSLHFLLTFIPHLVIPLLFKLARDPSHPINDVEYTLFNCFSYLALHSTNYCQIVDFGTQALSLVESPNVKNYTSKLLQDFTHPASTRDRYLAQICAHPLFQYSHSNLELVSQFAASLDSETNTNSNLMALIRMLRHLLASQSTFNPKASKMLAGLFGSKLESLAKESQYDNTLTMHAFLVSTDLGWYLPELHGLALSMLLNESWRTNLDVEKVFKAMAGYPGPRETIAHHLVAFVNLLTFNHVELLPYFKQLQSRAGPLPKNSYIPNYISYLQSLPIMKTACSQKAPPLRTDFIRVNGQSLSPDLYGLE